MRNFILNWYTLPLKTASYKTKNTIWKKVCDKMCSFALFRFSWAERVDRLELLRHHRNTGDALRLSAILGKVTQTFYQSVFSANVSLYLLTSHNPVNGITVIQKIKHYNKFKHVMLFNVLKARSLYVESRGKNYKAK